MLSIKSQKGFEWWKVAPFYPLCVGLIACLWGNGSRILVGVRDAGLARAWLFVCRPVQYVWAQPPPSPPLCSRSIVTVGLPHLYASLPRGVWSSYASLPQVWSIVVKCCLLYVFLAEMLQIVVEFFNFSIAHKWAKLFSWVLN